MKGGASVPPFFVDGHRSVTCGGASQMLDNKQGFHGEKRVRPDHEFTDGVRLGAIAVVSAVVTAMLVIGAGRAFLPQAEARAGERPVLVRASLP